MSSQVSVATTEEDPVLKAANARFDHQRYAFVEINKIGDGVYTIFSIPDGDEKGDFELWFDNRRWKPIKAELSENERSQFFPQELKSEGIGRIHQNDLRLPPRDPEEFVRFAKEMIVHTRGVGWYHAPIRRQ